MFENWPEARRSGGAIILAGFSIYATSVVENHSLAFTAMAVAAVYYLTTRTLEREVSAEALMAVPPVSLIAAILAVGGAFSFGELIGHPIKEEDAANVVRLACLLATTCAIGAFFWCFTSWLAREYLAHSHRWHRRLINRYLLSDEHAFLFGDAAVSVVFGLVLVTVLM